MKRITTRVVGETARPETATRSQRKMSAFLYGTKEDELEQRFATIPWTEHNFPRAGKLPRQTRRQLARLRRQGHAT